MTLRASHVPESFSLAYAPVMSTKHVRSAADVVRFKCALRIECGGCGNSKTLTGFEVATHYGTGPFAGIQRKMKCSRCGAKDARLTILPPPAPR